MKSLNRLPYFSHDWPPGGEEGSGADEGGEPGVGGGQARARLPTISHEMTLSL